METNAIIQQRSLGFTWDTIDPFLLCVHHDDAYPRGNGQLGPDASLAGRDIGQDFAGKDGWRMYHGRTVPGFPSHPHRGFETVTIVRKGFIDHADSLGAAARFGNGDVQWLTAGRGVVHSEMFPLLQTDQANPLELFQIWLNLPAAGKMAGAAFHDVLVGRYSASRIGGRARSHDRNHLHRRRSWPRRKAWRRWRRRRIRGQPRLHPTWRYGRSRWRRRRVGYCRRRQMRHRAEIFTSSRARASPSPARSSASMPRWNFDATQAVELINGDETSEFLLLQGRPINETVVQSGPFVMNSQQEITQAFADYSRTRFGGWPWPDTAPVHGADHRRFATYADGQTQTKPVARAA